MTKFLFLSLVLFSFVACSNDNASTPARPQETIKEEQTADRTIDPSPLVANAPNVYEFTSGPEGSVSIHIYSEDEIWVIEKNIIEADGLPTPLDRWTFTTKEKAYAFAVKELGINEAQRNSSALDKDPSSDILLTENLSSNDVLWKASNKWNWNWEVLFAKWMRENLHPAFFEKLGIENDCADAYYQARMIFAYENALPVSFRLAGNGAFFTQNTLRADWKKLKADSDWRKNKRFLKALDYVANTTYTHTLGRDTYPVQLSAEGLIEGTAYLYLDKASGHTLLVNEINLGDSIASKTRLPMYTLSSTVPKTVRPLYEAMFYESTQPEVSPYGHTGFVRFRWPKSSGAAALVDAKDMPYYSKEQYSPDLMVTSEGEEDSASKNFSIFVFKRLNPDFDPTLRITEGLAEVGEMMLARKDVITEGYKVCASGCADGSADYENWSTPSRDKRIKALIKDLEQYQSALYNFVEVRQAWEKALQEKIVEIEGVPYLLSHVKWTFENDFFSSNPNMTPALRWGLAPDAFATSSYHALVPLLEGRSAKIKSKDTCASSPTCLVFSDEYINKSTFIEDQDMQNSILLRNQYCEIAGPINCQSFNSFLASLTTIVPGHSHFLETWQKISLLNSDPRVSEAQRWGAVPTHLTLLQLDGQYVMSGRYKDKLVISKENYPISEIAILDSSTKTITPLEKTLDGGGYSLNKENGLLAIANLKNAVVTLYDITSLATQTLPLPEVNTDANERQYASVTWVSDTRFVVDYQSKLSAFEIVDNQLTFVSMLKSFSLAKKSTIAYKIANLQTTSGATPIFRVTVLDIFDSSKPTHNFFLNDYVSQKTAPTYLSFGDVMSKEKMLFQWSRYDTNGSASGPIVLDFKTGQITTTADIEQQSLSPILENVYLSTEYDDKNGSVKTSIYFLNEDLSVDKKITLAGGCNNCYDNGKNMQIGSSIYNLDLQKKTLVETLKFQGEEADAVSLSAVYGKYAVAYVNNNRTEFYSVLLDLKTGLPLEVAPSMSMDYQEGLFPLLTISKSHTVGSGDATKYYSLNLTLDIEQLSAGPIITPMYSNYEGEEGDGYEPRMDEDGNIIDAPELAPAPTNVKDLKLRVKLLTDSAIEEKTDSVSLIQLSDKQTLFIFR